MSSPSTLTEIIQANRRLDRQIVYVEGENDHRSVSFAQLYERALGILGLLQGMGAQPGDKVILYLSNNEAFIDAWWAGILGGIAPVPVAVGSSEEHRLKLLRIARTLGEPFIFSDRKTLDRIGRFAGEAGDQAVFDGLRRRALLLDDLSDLSRPGKLHATRPQDVAFIQFSSGSTSTPKGVVLTHANLIANWQGAAAQARFCGDDVTLSWMPLTHDMGLIGMNFFMYASGMRVHIMPTELFIRRPLLWLETASRIGATILASPNFGYRHYLKVLGERDPGPLDLSRVRILFNGAEPISAHLIDEFVQRLAPKKLSPTAMYPVYGLAEATLAASFPELGAPVRVVGFDRHRLAVGDEARPLPAGHTDRLDLVSVGRQLPNSELRVAGDNDAALPEGRVGHIQMRGPNVTSGYLDNPAANAALITADGWVRTGDLGVVYQGEFYVTGRAKEIIFVNGQNYYPHDLENIAIRAPDMELGKVVVAGVRPRDADTDQIVVFVLHRKDMKDFLPTAIEIGRLINEHAGLEVSQIVPVMRIPKTTSGKIQRHLLEAAFLAGEFDAEVQELNALRAAARGAAGATHSEIEARLLAICDQTLGGRALGVHDNLFELGASSLKLIEIHEQIDREYPGQVDLTELFDYPTIAELAAHLNRKLAAA